MYSGYSLGGEQRRKWIEEIQFMTNNKKLVAVLLTDEEHEQYTAKAVAAGYKEKNKGNYLRSLLGFAPVKKGARKKVVA